MTSPVIVALDFPNQAQALALVDQLDASLCRLKVGKELFTRLGPDFVEKLVGRGFDVFLDLKFHDIPNTVAAACDAAADLGVWMMNVHASGGRKMMEAARERLAGKSHQPKLIAVTILTSLGESDIQEIGFSGTPGENVLRLAALAESSGLDGVVCSPLEAAAIREQASKDFLLVTPGVRPATASLDDQKRVMTPADAMAAGSNYLVIGRPVTAAEDPLQALRDITASLKE
ncbi:orotidine-5'-phosphate decarboxylase [Thiolapillus brandeum]|uniref:Orotidine 5'-phosphate decarboxylase n=1 Tax=Thiolapillus brandeum TaxID=1076588 RepID=A0A7U6GIW6_9GAMM|nr:orotidine-5'-phosphate decarboxylase [Thiolapillus brandeum]BAO44427.1 orotidine-5'-phosphate decarboxylase [Thiolapillus brandeum]